METRNLRLPCDPMIAVIANDLKTSRAFQKSVYKLHNAVVPYRNTLHVSDDLLEAWYRFKENQPCQR